MLDTQSPFFKSIKRIVILLIALAIGLFLGGYLTYKSVYQEKPAAKELKQTGNITATAQD